MPFSTPLSDIRYTLDHVVDMSALDDLPAFSELSGDLRDAILEELGKLATDVIAPLNAAADRDGAQFENGVVRTPAGFKDAYRQYVEGGWNGLSASPDYGGQGLPFLLQVVVQESLHAACMGFGIGPTLTIGAAHALEKHGTDEQKQLYLPKLASGEWAGTMNLTEPQAGSDVGALRTKAEKADDGTYRISGQKIYITYGDHDLTENILHLVLARLPDAPAGTKGISLFLVPKFLVNEDGSLGARNDARVVGIEHKLGLHGSPTCTMAYGDDGNCVGYLVGEENKGMAAMFTMMNAARVDVGLQGVGIAERAYQQALDFALDRRQGRAPGAAPGEQAVIFEHADVRRMLYTMKAQIEAARAICYANALAADLARHGTDEDERHAARAREELLTPISKAWSTDIGIEVSSLNIQIHGGMGYVEETGAAQHYRDARIAAIYEGTNGIQALDLVGRKLPMEDGEVVRDFIDEIAATAAALSGAGDEDLSVIGANLIAAAGALGAATDTLLSAGPDDAAAGATPYLKLFGLAAGGHFLGRGALAAEELAESDADRAAFYRSKIALALFYAEHLLPQTLGLLGPATAGAAPVAKIDPELLAG